MSDPPILAGLTAAQIEERTRFPRTGEMHTAAALRAALRLVLELEGLPESNIADIRAILDRAKEAPK